MKKVCTWGMRNSTFWGMEELKRLIGFFVAFIIMFLGGYFFAGETIVKSLMMAFLVGSSVIFISLFLKQEIKE